MAKKLIKFIIITLKGLVVSPLILLLPALAEVKTGTIVEPNQITVAGIQGKSETREVFLRTSVPIANLQFIPLPLKNVDGFDVLPAKAIIPDQKSVKQISPVEFTVLVKFDLRNVPSGKYSGKLRLSYQNDKQTIPVGVIVIVKDDWYLPFLVLIIGTSLGISVSIYRAKGKPRDEILVRVGQLRAQMQDDPDLAKAQVFHSRVEAYLIDVRMAIQAQRWEEAEESVEQGELVWSKWSKGRGDWLAQLAYRDELDQRLQDLNSSIPYLQAVCRSLEDAVRDAPDLDGPDQLCDRFQDIAQQLNRYLQVDRDMRQLINLSAQLPPEEAKPWQAKVENLRQRLDNFSPSDLAGEKSFQNEVDDGIAEIKTLISQNSGIAKGLPIPGMTIPPLAPAPNARPLKLAKQVSGAGVRLRVFISGSYAIAVVFLAGAGFSELYVDHNTFGANPWKDYLGLLVWGFGAEATRDAVSKVVQGWGLPGLK
ncbi:MAG: hypothetical protein F6K55_10955 [Moorea sp. SIO4A3]|nr:hypothetical protein [Moorena sp. SIO4A3]